ncbi:AraC family transcriptional regulator [Pseudodesulfovibrio karagichevae]|uniref:Helix-turn-helix domain-containing protein n=1 Tax=Pseudodesulfovibrio karagichevae TaxID=3239305 RepID=A0ABV4K4Z2_9BACT
MDTSAIIRRLRTLAGRTALGDGHVDIPHLGLISSAVTHRLHAVSLSRSALFVILKGSKSVVRGNERTVLKAGEAFLCPARMEITVENCTDGTGGGYIALCLTYDEETIGRMAARETGPTPPAFSLETLKTPCSPLVEASLDHLLLMAAADPGNEGLLALCREELLLLTAGGTGRLPLLWDAASTWGARCARLIGMEPGRGWNAEAVAARLGASERSLRRHLSREGTSLTDVLREVRLNSGLALLQTGHVTVGEAAYRCGYNSASRFAGLFRERFGVSPSRVARYNAVLGPPLAGS